MHRHVGHPRGEGGSTFYGVRLTAELTGHVAPTTLALGRAIAAMGSRAFLALRMAVGIYHK